MKTRMSKQAMFNECKRLQDIINNLHKKISLLESTEAARINNPVPPCHIPYTARERRLSDDLQKVKDCRDFLKETMKTTNKLITNLNPRK